MVPWLPGDGGGHLEPPQWLLAALATAAAEAVTWRLHGESWMWVVEGSNIIKREGGFWQEI